MTVIVAIETPDCVWLGADRLASNGHTGEPVEMPKIFEREGVWFGICGSFRMGQILQYSLELPLGSLTDDVDRWVATDFITALREAFVAAHWGKETDGRAAGGNFLMIVKRRVYEIQGEYSFIRNLSGEYAIGSGEDYAKGSLHATRGQETDWRVREALDAASEFVVSVAGPYDFRQVF